MKESCFPTEERIKELGNKNMDLNQNVRRCEQRIRDLSKENAEKVSLRHCFHLCKSIYENKIVFIKVSLISHDRLIMRSSPARSHIFERDYDNSLLDSLFLYTHNQKIKL